MPVLFGADRHLWALGKPAYASKEADIELMKALAAETADVAAGEAGAMVTAEPDIKSGLGSRLGR